MQLQRQCWPAGHFQEIETRSPRRNLQIRSYITANFDYLYMLIDDDPSRTMLIQQDTLSQVLEIQTAADLLTWLGIAFRDHGLLRECVVKKREWRSVFSEIDFVLLVDLRKEVRERASRF